MDIQKILSEKNFICRKCGELVDLSELFDISGYSKEELESLREPFDLCVDCRNKITLENREKKYVNTTVFS